MNLAAIRTNGRFPAFMIFAAISAREGQSQVTFNKEEMVHPARFERATFRFGGEYSIQLSYGCPISSNCLRSAYVKLRPV